MKKNIFKIIMIIVCFAFVLIVALQKPETSFENASEQTEDGTEEVQTSEPVSEEEEEQVLTLAYSPGRSMNPIIGNSHNNRVIFSLLYQGLFAADDQGNVGPEQQLLQGPVYPCDKN